MQLYSNKFYFNYIFFCKQRKDTYYNKNQISLLSYVFLFISNENFLLVSLL